MAARDGSAVSEWQGPRSPSHGGALWAVNPGETAGPRRTEAAERRWDQLNEAARRAWSAEIGQREALAQGLDRLASPQQHRRVSAILAGAVKADAQTSFAGSSAPGKKMLRDGVRTRTQTSGQEK